VKGCVIGWRHRTRRYLFLSFHKYILYQLLSLSNIDKTIENTSTSTRRVVTHAHVGHTVVYACKDGRRSTTIYTLKITYQKKNTHTPTHRIIFISSQPTRPRPRRASAVRDDARASRTRSIRSVHSLFALDRSLDRYRANERETRLCRRGRGLFFLNFQRSIGRRSASSVDRERAQTTARDRSRRAVVLDRFANVVESTRGGRSSSNRTIARIDSIDRSFEPTERCRR
jgi:hypothetical protein